MTTKQLFELNDRVYSGDTGNEGYVDDESPFTCVYWYDENTDSEAMSCIKTMKFTLLEE